MQRFMSGAALMALTLAASRAWAGFEGPSPGVNLGDPSDPFDAFDLVARIGVGYDDNVQLAPDDTFFVPDTASTFVTGTINAVFRQRVTRAFTLGAALRVDGTAYLDDVPRAQQADFDNFSDYDLAVVNPSLFADTVIGGVDVRFAYDYRFEDARNMEAVGLDAHRVSVSLLKDLSPTWRIRGGASHQWNDYHAVFSPIDERDGTRTGVDFGVDYYIGGGITVLSANLNATVNDAHGRNWDYTGYGGSLAARTVVMPNLFASGEVGYEWRDYKGFVADFITAPGRTEQGIFTAKAKLVYAIDERYSVDLYVAYADHSANQPAFEGDKTTVGIGLTAKLY